MLSAVDEARRADDTAELLVALLVDVAGAAVAMKAVAAELLAVAWVAAAGQIAAVQMPMVSLGAAAVGLTAEVPPPLSLVGEHARPV